MQKAFWIRTAEMYILPDKAGVVASFAVFSFLIFLPAEVGGNDSFFSHGMSNRTKMLLY